ncbi:MAG: tetratricopeptide repeat protein [Rudaea sp.]
MIRNILLYVCTFALVELLAGCSSSPIHNTPVNRPNSSAAVIAIRKAGTQFESSVEVHPLADPAVDGLLRQARQFEAQNQPAQALADVRKALTITPKAPELLQYEAELLIETGAWKQAESLAQQSYDFGPKVGGLCARNLETLAWTRIALGDNAGAALARQQLAGCRVPDRARY